MRRFSVTTVQRTTPTQRFNKCFDTNSDEVNSSSLFNICCHPEVSTNACCHASHTSTPLIGRAYAPICRLVSSPSLNATNVCVVTARATVLFVQLVVLVHRSVFVGAGKKGRECWCSSTREKFSTVVRNGIKCRNPRIKKTTLSVTKAVLAAYREGN